LHSVSRPAGSDIRSKGPLAHRVEQGTFNPKVPGSRPGRPTEKTQFRAFLDTDTSGASSIPTGVPRVGDRRWREASDTVPTGGPTSSSYASSSVAIGLERCGTVARGIVARAVPPRPSWHALSPDRTGHPQPCGRSRHILGSGDDSQRCHRGLAGQPVGRPLDEHDFSRREHLEATQQGLRQFFAGSRSSTVAAE
jgi:hypothetical protein